LYHRASSSDGGVPILRRTSRRYVSSSTRHDSPRY
jgi:hypothetical protein